MKFFFAITFIVLFLIACKPSKKEIYKLIHSTGTCDRVKGFELIGKYEDTSFLRDIFDNPNDRKICHGLNHYGKSPLWAKVKALEKITNIKLPYEYDSFTLDTTALTFYKVILLKKGYLKWHEDDTTISNF